ncbi:DUF2381 family protein [Myxococcaceae bacterium GXIMD 01537]
MSQPLFALLAVLVGAAAAAQPFPLARVPQQRDVVLPSTPDALAPEVYVASGIITTLVMDGPLERTSVLVDEQVPHFALVDVGDRALTLKPRGEWGPEERLGLKARLKDGTLVALVLTTHPAQIDGWVNVVRPRSAESLLAENDRMERQLASLKAKCGVDGPVGMVLRGMLDATGVRVSSFGGEVPRDNPSGLELKGGVGYRGNSWAIVAVRLRNLPGQRPWFPSKARLLSAGGREVRVFAVHLEKPLAAGDMALVVVDAQRPPDDAGEEFRLELADSGGGRFLAIPGVKL